MASPGVALLRRLTGTLEGLEVLAYGAPLGAVLSSLALLALACVFGLSASLVWTVALAAVAVALALGPARPGRLAVVAALRPARWVAFPRALPFFAVAVLAAFGVRWLLLFHGTLT